MTTILIIDDSQLARNMVSGMVRGARPDWEIVTAKNADDALEKVSDIVPDVAIVDFNMFPLDGVEFTRLVRNSPDSANPYLPIIMMTGHSERSRVTDARDAGVTEFVVKPITAKAILDRINAVVFKPRPFVKTDTYFGPCRRRRDEFGYAGPFRRATDAKRA